MPDTPHVILPAHYESDDYKTFTEIYRQASNSNGSIDSTPQFRSIGNGSYELVHPSLKLLMSIRDYRPPTAKDDSE